MAIRAATIDSTSIQIARSRMPAASTEAAMAHSSEAASREKIQAKGCATEVTPSHCRSLCPLR